MTRAFSPFGDLRPAGPPPALRGRVLEAARRATTTTHATLVDRIWESRILRLAAAVVLVLLLAAHLSIDRPYAGALSSSGAEALAESIAGTEGLEEASLPRDGPRIADRMTEMDSFLREEEGASSEGGKRRNQG
jgi:hypothetical protein